MVPSPENSTTPVQERTYVKILAAGGKPPYHRAAATGFRYRLPRWKGAGWTPGAWAPTVRKIKPCVSGYHLIRLDHIPHWITGYPATCRLYVAEPGDMLVEHDLIGSQPKVVTDRVRLLRPVEGWGIAVWRAWAADCAEHVLPIYETRYPNNARPREAIEAARAYGRGEITRAQLLEARSDAAYAAYAADAYAADADAAAAYAADAAYAAAAAYAAYAADADAAAYAAARHQERRWQAQRLAELLGLPWEIAGGAS